MKTFSCPQCGGTLEIGPAAGATVECPYCRSTVVVPAELRAPVAASAHAPRRAPLVLLVALIAAAVLLVAFLSLRSARRSVPPLPPRVSFTPLVMPTPPAIPTPPAMTPQATGVLLTFGGEGTGDGLFQNARKLAVDTDGHIYVADETRRVQKFDPTGKFLSVWLLPAQSQWYTKFRGGPDKVLAERAGNIDVLASGVLLKFDRDGQLLGAAHGTDYIRDAALTADDGLLLVSEKGADDELVRLDARGRPLRRVHRFLSSVLDKRLAVGAVRVAADGLDNIYAVYALGDAYGEFWYDAEDLTVVRFTPEGKYVNRFGSYGSGAGQYQSPNCINADNQSRVYICDGHNGIHLFAPDGRYLEQIKTPFWVEGMALDRDNNIYIAGSNKVAKLAARP